MLDSAEAPEMAWYALIRSPLALALGLAGSVGAASAQPRTCLPAAQNLYVRDLLQQHYYWNESLTDPNPTKYGSPEAYLEAVRYLPLDQSYSYIAPKAASQAFFSESQFVGLGLSTRLLVSASGEAVEMRLSEVFPGGPASGAGLARGDRVEAINGRPVADWWLAGQLGDAFGPAAPGVVVELVLRRGEAAPHTITMAKRVVTIPPVSDVRVFEVDGVKTGYVVFRTFVEPSTAALDAAFAALQAAGVRELILDLRYNGGGLVGVAQHLASLIGGARTGGQVLAEYVHNNLNIARNRAIRFDTPARALTLDRLVVITTRATASSSELIINGLRPYMPVIVVGDTTYGKPVGQYAFDFCDKTAFPVAFVLRNANREANYFFGIPPTCPAVDDLDHALGDVAEASLAEALSFVSRGGCSRQTRSFSTRRVDWRSTTFSGLAELIGAW
ncbi:MAG: S41 family peptidase [Vicinamibacterales bacterium]